MDTISGDHNWDGLFTDAGINPEDVYAGQPIKIAPASTKSTTKSRPCTPGGDISWTRVINGLEPLLVIQ